jgi:hypothetical protein
MKTLAALLLCASASFAQFGFEPEPEQIIHDMESAAVARVVASNPAEGTNEKPPVVTLEIVEVLKGKLAPGKIDAIWKPKDLYLQCGVGAESAIARWNQAPCPGPAVGTSLIVGLDSTGGKWTALPELREPNTPEALERTKLAIEDPRAAREARMDLQTVALLKKRPSEGVVLSAENAAAVLRHLDLMADVEHLCIFEVALPETDLKKLATLPHLSGVELVFNSVTVEDLERLGASLPLTGVTSLACAQLPDGFHAAIAKLPKLRDLALPQFTGLSVEQAAIIATSKSIATIRSSSGRLSPGATAALKPLTTLESLTMHFETKLTVEDAEALATFPHLKVLAFEYTSTTPEALSKLAASKSLESLDIYCLDDAELAAVATVSSLKALRIYDPKEKDDKSLLVLAKLENLKELYLATHIMPAARVAVVEELKAKLKGCSIR